MLLFILIFSFASIVFPIKVFNKQCSLELEKIDYSPNYFHKNYLEDISKELGNFAFYYDTPQGKAFVNDFSVKYTVIVSDTDAFVSYDYYAAGNIGSVPLSKRKNFYSSRDA